MTALPKHPHHHHPPGASSWEFHTPARRHFLSGCGSKPWPQEDLVLVERPGYLLGGLVLLSWVQLQEDKEESWTERVGVQVPGSILSDALCVCAYIPYTSHSNCPSCGAGQNGWDRAQGLALDIGQDGAGSPGDAPGGCKALWAESGRHPAPQRLLPTWHQAPMVHRDSHALRSSEAMLGPSRENALPGSLPIAP